MIVYGYFRPKSLVQRLRVLYLLAAERDNFCDCVLFFSNKGLSLALFPPTWTRPAERNRHPINGSWVETSAKPGRDSHIGELRGGGGRSEDSRTFLLLLPRTFGKPFNTLISMCSDTTWIMGPFQLRAQPLSGEVPAADWISSSSDEVVKAERSAAG